MGNTFLSPVTSIPSLNFTEALAQYAASAMNNLAGSPLATRWCLIRAILVETAENYAPQLNFFSSASGQTADPATDAFLGSYGFTAAMGVQINAAGIYRYWASSLDIPYVDADAVPTTNPSLVHVVLENTGATSKSAYPVGSTKVTIWLEPMQAY
jgi:hypothetical protein